MSHQWDKDGERCVKCGAKDWMGGSCSTTPVKRKASALARRITDRLFERDNKPGNQMPQLLGGDMVDPNREGIEATVREVLEEDPFAWEDKFWREVGPQP